jgi:hypothetical protein
MNILLKKPGTTVAQGSWWYKMGGYPIITSNNMAAMKTPHPTSLGDFIRTRWDRLSPEQVGLHSVSRRRAKGLRREELAALCGISPTWLTWIEQGRTTSVSAQTVSRIGDALLLTKTEREYLFELAGVRDPSKSWNRPRWI